MMATTMLLATPAVSLAGDIVAAPGATAAQIQAMNDCISKISTTGQTVKGVGEVLDGLKSPKNPYNVTIAFSNEDLTEGESATNKANASNHKGSGSTVTWNPNDHAEFFDNPPVKADPCGTLIHELKHAYDATKGTLTNGCNPQTRAGCWGDTLLDYDEVTACRVENEYRDANGLDKRTRYVDPLPPYATDVGNPQPPPPPVTGQTGAGTKHLVPPSGGNTGTGNTGGGTTGGGNTGGGNTGGGTTGGGTGNTGSGNTGGGTTGGGNTGGGTTGGGNTGGGTTGGGNTGGGTTGGGNTGGGTTGGGNTGAGNTGGGSTGGGTSGGGP
jgi:hypothetical protein